MESPVCTRSPLSLLAIIAGVLFLSSGCSILFSSPDCPDLDRICPDVECDTFVQSQGCDICECADEPEPPATVCWDSGDCASGQVCNSTDFCESPPGCDEGQPCPDVCYGRCVAPPSECFSDADCDAGELCRLGEVPQEARPAPPCEPGTDCDTEPGDALIAPSGICVPGGCDDRFDFPACPPGTVPDVDFTIDECGEPVCRPVDDCRDRDPSQCESTPGCRLEEIPQPCECEPGTDCQCAADTVCVPDDSCRDLGPEECDASPNCEGFFIAPPTECFEECDAAGNCFVACPEEDPIGNEGDFICTPRVNPSDCRGDFDCGPGFICEITVRCDEANCFQTPDGQVICEDSCEEFGSCVETGSSCFDLDPNACLDDPRCELLEDGGAPAPCFCDPDDANCDCAIPEPVSQCVPRQPDSCNGDFDCRNDERCDLTTTCPPCADGDPACGAPCFLEGVCVPLPTDCSEDSQCAPGQRCDVREICPPCAPPEDPNEPFVCECFVEGSCVQDNNVCFSDFECGNDQFCDFSDPFCGVPGPNGLIACGGICADRDPVPPGVCLEDGDCGPAERCATELDVCVCPASDPNCSATGVCFSQCVPLDNGDSCFESSDCREGLVCDTQNFCDAPPDCPNCTVCAGRCIDPNDPTEGFCRSDDECRPDQHCGFEQIPCTSPPGTTTNECWSVCLDDSPAGRLCLEDNDCPDNNRCATEQDICFCPDNTTCEVCFSECVAP